MTYTTGEKEKAIHHRVASEAIGRRDHLAQNHSPTEATHKLRGPGLKIHGPRLRGMLRLHRLPDNGCLRVCQNGTS